MLIQSFTYNYPYREAVITAVDRWKTHFTYLQQEILENLIILDEPARKSYLKRLTLDCENHLKHAQVTIADLDDWLTQYQTDVWDTVDPYAFIKAELHEILASEPETFKESLQPGVNPASTTIRYAFYNYFYGHFLSEALTFIEAQTIISPVNFPKLKTKLTVPQLSYLFRLLMDEDIFDQKTKTEVHRFIAAAFETSKANQISADSVKNNMDNPDAKSIDHIQGKLIHILQTVQKDKKDLGK
ncbi:hypothetical protein [Mucilaginibacter sp. KACC 22063]|uniref:hypothetical protein n=1 Tax=Mucilaginibacter sp. KACC 22063 TaxID=3025666 RepID=UPI0023662C57|nr:hypothetical protein [Mucilaginibacter sp. KACC 22063]WDF57201.1 hypothetical protein PQ461_09055 [Mucilaginibacter sp. KACC 22063]